MTVSVWAIADLHLANGNPQKNMEVFGMRWHAYMERLKDNWSNIVSSKDLVLLCGDLSWASRLEEAKEDMVFIDELPGMKIMIKGNHDFWWNSLSKMKQVLPKSIIPIQNTIFETETCVITGSRLWESSSIKINPDIFEPSVTPWKEKEGEHEYNKKIFEREVVRLESVLKQLPNDERTKIVMTHYPPIGTDGQATVVSDLLNTYHIDICVFGHLHNVLYGTPPFQMPGRTKYFLVAADFLSFTPLQIL